MVRAHHSAETLKAMLDEASARLACSSRALGRRIDDLRRSIERSGVVSASLEQEIVSHCAQAELESRAEERRFDD